ncbi:multidrug resistance-associated protein 1-like [Cylas formicarius]|uniref:multidrug resistance-associated protein 1-like n=1 Tax=Cylas formicarius TaxID=197179 RepID=UPI002958321E|nr:multidrug resistance-associated protein 1-like [Cylas formicarius]
MNLSLENEALNRLCGSPFWNSSLSWDTNDPDFTKCFEKTVLVWIPCVFLWIFSPLEVYYIKNSKDRDIPWNWKNSLKFLATALLCANCLSDLIVNADAAYGPPVNTYTPLVKLASFALAGTLAFYNKRYGLQSSGLLFLFWFFTAVLATFQFRTEIRTVKREGAPDDQYEYVSYLVYYPLVVAMFLLNCFGEGTPRVYQYAKAKKKNPEDSCSFPSRITFLYLDPMLFKGFRKPLQAKDMWDMRPDDSAEAIVPVFEGYFNKALAKSKNIEKEQRDKVSYKADGSRVEFKRHSKQKTASFLPALCKTVYFPFLIGSAVKFIADVTQFANPQILGLLIGFVGSDEPRWRGIFYAVLMFIVACVQTLLQNKQFDLMFKVGIRTRTALTAAIYRKALRVSNVARKEKTAGEIVNLMAVDAQKFQDLVLFLNLLWSSPFQICLAVYFLWQELGPSIMAGLAVMILLIPINGFIVNKNKKLQIKQMKDKDERVKLMNEILSGIKILKLYAWEPSFEQQVMKIRNKEVSTLRKSAYLDACTTFIWNCAPFMVSCVTFATYVLIDERNVLDAGKAFVSLSLFNILRMPLSFLPMTISQLVQTWVSVKRLNGFFNAEDLDENSVSHDPNETDPLVIENGTFSWGEGPVLKDINIRVANRSLTAVVGAVGAGKSSLISVLLGEMEKIRGHVNTLGSVAYVPQQAWIQNATVQDNITFGEEFDKIRYQKVIEACALKPDFEMLANGDQTEIGEKGINLSGGQKQRISLARAVYYDADVYLLDDPLSAVDSHVGKHIFDHLLSPTGLLRNKTRVLVTHAVTYLPQTDKIIVLKDGEVSETGTYKELLKRKGAFAEFLIQHISEGVDDEEELQEIEDQLVETPLTEDLKRTISRQRSKVSESHSDTGSNQGLNGFVRTKSTESLRSGKSIKRKPSRAESIKPAEKKERGKLIEAEKMETGKVKLSVYTYYLGAIGGFLISASTFFNAGFQGFGIGSNLWLGRWSEDTNMVVNGTVDTGLRDMYLGIYALLGICQAISIFASNICFAYGTMNAAVKLHNLVLSNVMRLPMSFFDVTPSGRILGRFSSDIIGVDLRLPMNFNVFFLNSIKVIGTLFVICYTTPLFAVVIIPIAVLYLLIQRYYVATSRQLKRLESVSRSPIYSHFGETITGTHVIRAYKQQDRFIKDSDWKVDLNQMCVYPSMSSNRWLGVRLEMIGNSIIFFAALFAVLGSDLMPALVGLSVSYSMQITQTLNWLVRMTSDVETNIVAVERIKEYGEIPQEAAWEIPNKTPKRSWPDDGAVNFRDYSVRYRPGLDLVLKGVNFQVGGGEKIGIVGRTGAGKSSLTLSLFRIIEAAAGKIAIDDVDISEIGLHSLRSRLTIIPQDAILFSGSLRMNLDPFDNHTDDEVWKALELAHLKPFVKGLAAGLAHKITEGGDNLSVGQRQLICLARALLRKTKVLILDEATAAVDLETDDLIQKTIRTEFAKSTVITIAHRLNTIMDSDRILVLDKGQIAEFDTPASLLENKGSIFYGMCKDAGLAG